MIPGEWQHPVWVRPDNVRASWPFLVADLFTHYDRQPHGRALLYRLVDYQGNKIPICGSSYNCIYFVQ